VRRLGRWGAVGLLGLGLCCGSARAQTFGPPVPTELVLVLLDREGTVRFTLASYYTLWENPFRLTLLRMDGSATRTVTRTAQTPSSPLIEGTYVLSRRWSAGFWYNPIRGERLKGPLNPFPDERSQPVNMERDVDLADLHVAYNSPHGLSVQLGYYREDGTYRDLLTEPALITKYRFRSWNIWFNQRLDLLFRGRLTTDRLGRRLMTHFIPFLSAGYHTSGALGHPVSALAGLAVTYNDRVSLSGSVWLFDLAHPSTRITGGLVVQF
jgi:hypothetical protein